MTTRKRFELAVSKARKAGQVSLAGRRWKIGRRIRRYGLVPVLILAIGIGCGEKREPENPGLSKLVTDGCRYDINGFILDKLIGNRIVMLADSRHGQSLYLQTVTAFLNAWMDTLIDTDYRDNRIPRKLLFVQESDSVYAGKLREYFATGDIWGLMKLQPFLSEKYTTAKLEFYFDLGQILRRIGEYNRRADSALRISLDVIGPESPADFYAVSRDESARYFIHERDRKIADEIERLLAERPDHKTLLFYGSAHLSLAKTRKRAGSRQSDSYYMAHYLAEDMGYDSIYTIGQLSLPGETHEMSQVMALPGRPYAIEVAPFDSAGYFRDHARQKGEGLIVLFSEPAREKPIHWILSENSVQFVIANLDSFKDMSEDFRRELWPTLAGFMAFVSGLAYADVDAGDDVKVDEVFDAWRGWYETASFDFVRDIKSLSRLERVLELMEQAKTELLTSYDMILCRALGINRLFDGTQNPAQLAQAYREYIEESRHYLVIDNLVHLLWLGTDKEKKQARSILEAETGEEFLTAKEWTVWWRQTWQEQP